MNQGVIHDFGQQTERCYRLCRLRIRGRHRAGRVLVSPQSDLDKQAWIQWPGGAATAGLFHAWSAPSHAYRRLR